MLLFLKIKAPCHAFFSIPANRPDLIGIVPIFELQNLKKSGHSNFLREKRTFSLEDNVGIFGIFIVGAVRCW